MDLSFHAILAETYKSPSQRIRILSEHWIGSQAFCVNCGHRPILSHPNNSKIADFFCAAAACERLLLQSGDGFYIARCEHLIHWWAAIALETVAKIRSEFREGVADDAAHEGQPHLHGYVAGGGWRIRLPGVGH